MPALFDSWISALGMGVFITQEKAVEIVESSITTLRSVGKDESWLQTWITQKPARLGLGELVIKRCELVHYKKKGGRLDILAYRGDLDTFYEIEVMLGECDSDHGFRVLDYWARERVKNPNVRHYAVLVAEDLSGRYKTVIDTLPQFLPFIGIEIRTRRLQHPSELSTVEAFIVSQPDDLIDDAGDEAGDDEGGISQPKDRDWWEANSPSEFIATVDTLVKYCNESLGPSRVDYSAQSYISLKKGRRCWLPMWPRNDGTYIYLPGGGGAEDAPSDFYNFVRAKLQEGGLGEPNWTYTYNAGANPIAFMVAREKAAHSHIREILARAYELA